MAAPALGQRAAAISPVRMSTPPPATTIIRHPGATCSAGGARGQTQERSVDACNGQPLRIAWSSPPTASPASSSGMALGIVPHIVSRPGTPVRLPMRAPAEVLTKNPHGAECSSDTIQVCSFVAPTHVVSPTQSCRTRISSPNSLSRRPPSPSPITITTSLLPSPPSQAQEVLSHLVAGGRSMPRSSSTDSIVRRLSFTDGLAVSGNQPWLLHSRGVAPRCLTVPTTVYVRACSSSKSADPSPSRGSFGCPSASDRSCASPRSASPLSARANTRPAGAELLSSSRLCYGKRVSQGAAPLQSARCVVSSSSSSGAATGARFLKNSSRSSPPVWQRREHPIVLRGCTSTGAPPPSVRAEAWAHQQLRGLPPVMASPAAVGSSVSTSGCSRSLSPAGASAAASAAGGSAGSSVRVAPLGRTVIRLSSGSTLRQQSWAVAPPSPGASVKTSGGPSRISSGGKVCSPSSHSRTMARPWSQFLTDLPVPESPPTPANVAELGGRSGCDVLPALPFDHSTLWRSPSPREPSDQQKVSVPTSVVVWTTDDEVTMRRSWTFENGDAVAACSNAFQLSPSVSATTCVPQRTSPPTVAGAAEADQAAGFAAVSDPAENHPDTSSNKQQSPDATARYADCVAPATVCVAWAHSASNKRVQQAVESAAEIEHFVSQMLQLCLSERRRVESEFAAQRGILGRP